MPIYEYECEKCGRVDEVIQKMSDKPLSHCQHCNGRVHKLISHSAFHLKGTGWYVTDYAGKKNAGSQTTAKEAAPEKTEKASPGDKEKDAKSV